METELFIKIRSSTSSKTRNTECSCFWFGTVKFGRDVLSRILVGLRYTLIIGFASVVLSLLIGLFLGGLAGFFGGKIDAVISILINVFWSLPTILLGVALVGYTNVGKSTIMNMLSKSQVFAENKLFATLETTVRKVTIDNLFFLLSDTVGFIRKLPTQLVESFKSTLDEVREADVLIHVVDISHKSFEDHINVVKQTLQDIGAGDNQLY